MAAARTRLILDKPFLGALVLRLPLEPADPDWCPTTATDARKFYFNPSYVEALSLDETQFVLAHEALHCALSHFARRQHRVRHRWDLACDFAINPLLVDDGLKAPPGSLLLDRPLATTHACARQAFIRVGGLMAERSTWSTMPVGIVTLRRFIGRLGV